ncbi:unnamed protein product [Amaranthus hypochondriacus]
MKNPIQEFLTGWCIRFTYRLSCEPEPSYGRNWSSLLLLLGFRMPNFRRLQVDLWGPGGCLLSESVTVCRFDV